MTTVKGSEFEFSIKEGNVYSQRLNPFTLAPRDQTTQQSPLCPRRPSWLFPGGCQLPISDTESQLQPKLSVSQKQFNLSYINWLLPTQILNPNLESSPPDSGQLRPANYQAWPGNQILQAALLCLTNGSCAPRSWLREALFTPGWACSWSTPFSPQPPSPSAALFLNQVPRIRPSDSDSLARNRSQKCFPGETEKVAERAGLKERAGHGGIPTKPWPDSGRSRA